ncbi:hypothetical protein Tco_1332674 [Tanacetum coccineum]
MSGYELSGLTTAFVYMVSAAILDSLGTGVLKCMIQFGGRKFSDEEVNLELSTSCNDPKQSPDGIVLVQAIEGFRGMPNDSKEGVENNVGLRNHDVRWKDDVECEEIELRVSEMDDNNQYVSVLDKSYEENVEDSSILDYGVDGMKNNASTIGVSEIGVVDVYDGMFNFSEGDGTSNFNKPVDIIKECSVEQNESRKENNNQVASEIVIGKFVNEYAKRKECESLSFEKMLDVGLEIQTVAAETLPCSLPTVVGANEHTIHKEKGCNKAAANGFDVCNNEDTSCKVAICYDQLSKRLICGHVPFLSTILSNGTTQKRKMVEIGDSLFPTLGLNGLGDSRDQTFTYGMKFEIKMSGLNGNSLIVDLETAKMNEDSLGHLKFDIWKWPKRRRKGAKCKVKNRGWKFDFWKWPKRKKSCLTKCKFEHGKWKFDVWIWPNRKKETNPSFCTLVHTYQFEFLYGD